MATITLLETARQRRLNALASLGTPRQDRYDDNIVSIFDFAFDEPAEASKPIAASNVVAFRPVRPHIVAATETATPDRIAA